MMKAFKKIALVAAAALLAVGATACSSSSSSKNTSNKKPQTAKRAKNVNKTGKWSYSNKTFKTNKLAYKFTKAEVQPSAAEGKNNLVLHVDVTNNSKKEVEPGMEAYTYIHGTQKTSTSKVTLAPGTSNIDDNGNSQFQAEEDNMNNKLLAGKTVKGVVMFELKNDTPVTVTFDNAVFKTIGKEVYNVK